MATLIDFTDDVLSSLAVARQGTRAEYRDSGTAGLYLRVSDKGIKTYSFVGRPKGADGVVKPERVTLGRFPAISAELARAKARAIAYLQANGFSGAVAAKRIRGVVSLEDLHALTPAAAAQPLREEREHRRIRELVNSKLEEVAIQLLEMGASTPPSARQPVDAVLAKAATIVRQAKFKRGSLR